MAGQVPEVMIAFASRSIGTASSAAQNLRMRDGSMSGPVLLFSFKALSTRSAASVVGSSSVSCEQPDGNTWLYSFSSRSINLYLPEKVLLNSSALPPESRIQAPDSSRSAGMLPHFPRCSLSSRDFAHQALDPLGSAASSDRVRCTYASCSSRIPSLQASAASRSRSVPTASTFSRTSRSTLSVNQGWVDFFSAMLRLGMHCSDSRCTSEVNAAAASSAPMFAMWSQDVFASSSRSLSQSAFANCQTSRFP